MAKGDAPERRAYNDHQYSCRRCQRSESCMEADRLWKKLRKALG